MTTSVSEKQGNGSSPAGLEPELSVVLACFDKPDGAAKARASLEGNEDTVLDNTIISVNERHEASVHDARRVVMGTLAPLVTWGIFGLIAGGWTSALIWAVLGAICGGFYTYYKEHHATKAQLDHIGKSLPAKSSALLTFAETSDPKRTLHALADHAPSTASIAAIDADLSARVYAGAGNPIEVGHSSGRNQSDLAVLDSMILIRYADLGAAKQVAKDVKASKTQAAQAAEVELVVETEANGHRHVTDPTLGAGGFFLGDAIGWALFGIVCGGISGAFAGNSNGIIDGIIKGGLLTGLGWGVFGLFAGAVYGWWAGRAVSAGRLKGLGPVLAPGTSAVLAWTDGAVTRETLDLLTKDQPKSDQLVLHFNPAESGALLAAP